MVNINRIVLIVGFICFCAFILFLLNREFKASFSQNKASSLPHHIQLSGRFQIISSNDLRVSGKKIVLCGVSFTKSKQVERLLLSAAQRALEGKDVNCIQVGGGTPCDGKAAIRYGDAPVVQCFTSDRQDIAKVLSDKGITCDIPAQSGGHYRSC